MNIAHVDIETFSRIDLKKVGLYRYSEESSTEILCVGFAINNKKPCLWIPYSLGHRLIANIKEHIPGIKIYWQPVCPLELRNADQYRAHNAEFEITLLNSHAGEKIGFPKTKIDQWVCTAAKAAYWGLPRDLENACIQAETEHKKDSTNRTNMLQVSKPKKPSKKDPSERYTLEDHFDKFIKLYKYNIDDVYAERDLDVKLPDIPEREQKLYQLNHKMNMRGVKLDIPSAKNAIYLKDEYKRRLNDKCRQITGFNATQREKLAIWLEQEGCKIPDLTAETVKIYLKSERNKKIKRVLRIRQLHEMKTPEKYKKMLLSVCSDRRLHGMFLYYGASTGRWSSLIVNLQNLFRGGEIKNIDTLIECYKERDVDFILMLFDDLMYALSSSIRGMLVADKGKVFNCADYSAIEGRITTWLAGDEQKLNIYRTHGKVYEHTAARLFDMKSDLQSLLEMKKKYPDKRFAGKTSELALGYQGAVGALQRAAKKDGVVFTEEYALDIVRRWRKANPKTKNLWYNLENAAVSAVQHPGVVFTTNRCMFCVKGDWLRVRLPSNSILNYYKPQLQEGQRGPKVTYMGIDTKGRGYKRVDTYGGRWTENIASRLARDIMANGMVRLDKRDFGLVGTVHDEIVSEDDDDRLEEMIAEMCAVQSWAKDIPIKAAGWVGKRYKKDD